MRRRRASSLDLELDSHPGGLVSQPGFHEDQRTRLQCVLGLSTMPACSEHTASGRQRNPGGGDRKGSSRRTCGAQLSRANMEVAGGHMRVFSSAPGPPWLQGLDLLTSLKCYEKRGPFSHFGCNSTGSHTETPKGQARHCSISKVLPCQGGWEPALGSRAVGFS